jgi:hypothetical protein
MWYLLSRLCDLMVRTKSKAVGGIRPPGTAQRSKEMAATSRGPGMTGGIAGTAAEAQAQDIVGPVGIAFEIPELLMLAAWAEFHDLRLVIELDYDIDGDEYEEVAVLYLPGGQLRRWMLWRARDAVVVEPTNGAAFRVSCIADLLQRLVPAG